MNTYFGYLRVSTTKQGEGVSLEAQKEAIHAYATQNDIVVSEWFEEKETAAKQGRPVFNEMVKSLRVQRAQGLIVHKIDRSARNFRDWARIGDLADEGFDIRFATETLDFQTRGGRLSADIQAVIAADYIRNLREEIRKGIDGRLKQGLYPFAAPIGYLDNGRGKAKTPDPIRAPLIIEMFQLYASGAHSLRSLGVELTKRGLTNRSGEEPSKRLIETALSNPFYCGIIKIATTGATYEGIHEPLIDRATFERVQEIKSGKSGKKVTKHRHMFRGLFVCGHCQYAMIPEHQKGRVYYRCHSHGCPTTGLREDHIEEKLVAQFSTLRIDAKAREKLVARVSSWVDSRIKASREHSICGSNAREIESRLERLTDAMIDNLIDRDAYLARREKLLLERAEERKRGEIHQALQESPENVRRFLELTNNLEKLYISLDRDERRSFVDSATSNRTITEKNLQFELADWLQTIPNYRAVPNGEHTVPNSRTKHKSDYEIITRLVEAAASEKAVKFQDFIENSEAAKFSKKKRESPSEQRS